MVKKIYTDEQIGLAISNKRNIAYQEAEGELHPYETLKKRRKYGYYN